MNATSQGNIWNWHRISKYTPNTAILYHLRRQHGTGSLAPHTFSPTHGPTRPSHATTKHAVAGMPLLACRCLSIGIREISTFPKKTNKKTKKLLFLVCWHLDSSKCLFFVPSPTKKWTLPNFRQDSVNLLNSIPLCVLSQQMTSLFAFCTSI